jgi:hypothetical protein
LRTSEALDVAKIFRTTGGALVPNKRGTANEVYVHLAEWLRYAIRPRFCEGDSREVGENIYSAGGDAELIRQTSLTSFIGAPNAASARMTRPAFSAVGSIHTSRSPVARGRPWIASAYAPTIRNLTSAAMNARNRSTKSGFIGKFAAQTPQFLAQTPHVKHPFRVRQLPPEFDIMTVCFRGVRKPPDGDIALR